jgi:hypothetical protein
VRFIPTPAEDAGGGHNGKKMKGATSNLFGVARSHERWARFRFSVIGPLLAAPPEWGELQEQLKSLAAKKWHHPITGQRVQFGLSTIERWFYTARNEKKDPVQALRRKIRSDQGLHPALSPKLSERSLHSIASILTGATSCTWTTWQCQSRRSRVLAQFLPMPRFCAS